MRSEFGPRIPQLQRMTRAFALMSLGRRNGVLDDDGWFLEPQNPSTLRHLAPENRKFHCG
jgi:hypothetical protein